MREKTKLKENTKELQPEKKFPLKKIKNRKIICLKDFLILSVSQFSTQQLLGLT